MLKEFFLRNSKTNTDFFSHSREKKVIYSDMAQKGLGSVSNSVDEQLNERYS